MANIFVRALAALGFADLPSSQAEVESRGAQPEQPLPPVDSAAGQVPAVQRETPSSVGPAAGGVREVVAEPPPARSPSNGGSLRMVRATPTTMHDAKQIAERLKRGMPVAMNLEDVEEAAARRIIDFVSGATYALSGSIKKIGRAVFLCSPGGLPVEELATPQRVPSHLFDAVEDSPDLARL